MQARRVRGELAITVVDVLSGQVVMAAVLSAMDAELSAREARRDKTRALENAMMQELLTGDPAALSASSPQGGATVAGRLRCRFWIWTGPCRQHPSALQQR